MGMVVEIERVQFLTLVVTAIVIVMLVLQGLVQLV
ncbi:unnamed protein product [Brugia pahangi]|uniref:Preprotein translocase subunit Sec61beta n=1 Tax=Brugia pahangi TaxID=6280 RepID=A0A0N4T3D6_BRUPA|nr:unnamed protein product [Brugia pahangi]VDN83908.1 unnamed protein product [Brugia pahangi]